MKRRRVLKLTLENAVNDLRRRGFKPLFSRGRLVDWRRVKAGELQTAEVTVHASGRTTIVYRSSANGKGTGRRRNRQKGGAAQSTGKVDTTQT